MTYESDDMILEIYGVGDVCHIVTVRKVIAH